MIYMILVFLMIGANPSGYTGLLWVHADACALCQRMEPVVNDLIVEGEPIIVVKINLNKGSGFVRRFVPATIVYVNGVEVGRHERELGRNELKKILKRERR